MPPEGVKAEAGPAPKVEPYAWYVLFVLMVVYIFNFVDRQLITILAPELKRDLGISDSDFGFLYGTAFGVFYALFGIPLGKLADRWLRVRLLAVGLTLWSLMTALSGLSRNFAQIAVARMGVGIGEATLAPCAYSLVSDYFPARRRATALGIYSAGLYLGTGVSLYLGSTIVEAWNIAYSDGGAPLGLSGWQVAFFALGLPGIAMALWVATLREPVRGAFDPKNSLPARSASEVSPWTEFLCDLSDIVPPLTLVGAYRRGIGALLANLAAATAIALAAAALVAITGDTVQWIAFGLGCYAIVSWLAAMRHRDADAFASLFASRAFLGVTFGYSLLSFLGYTNFGFAPLFAIQELGAQPAEAGFMLGSLGALAGTIGIIGGGILADYFARDGIQAKRVIFVGLCGSGTMVGHAIMFSATTLGFYYAAVAGTLIFMSATLSASSGTIVNIVPPHLRGMAAAGFLLATNMIGLALGPYTGGKLSELFGDLRTGMLGMLIALPLMIIALVIGYRGLRDPGKAARAH